MKTVWLDATHAAITKGARVLVDHPDELFEFETLPQLERRDRTAYLARQLAQRFPDSDFRAARLLADGRVCYHALPKLPALASARSVHSVVLVAARILTKQAPEAVLALLGERLLFIVNGELYFVRRIDSRDPDAEIGRTRQYLAASQTATLDCPLWRAEEHLDWPAELLAAASKAPPDYPQVKSLNKGVIGLALALVLALSGLADWQWARQQAQKNRLQIAALQAQIQRLQAAQPIPLQVMQAARSWQLEARDVEASAQAISRVFIDHPLLELDRFEWRVASGVETAKMQGRAQEMDAVLALQAALAPLAKVETVTSPVGQFGLQMEMKTP